MKILKKAFSVIFTLAFLLSVFAFDSTVVNATEATTEETTTEATTEAPTYTYRIKISLGNNEKAYFDDAAVAKLNETYKVSKSGRNLIISGLKYGKDVEFNFTELIKVNVDNSETNTSKYYVKGLRVAGSDDLVKDTNKDVTLHVVGDESYVVAYGVGNIIPYTVRYVDEDANELLPDETLYAAEGEVVYVPARHIKGYVPDYYYRTASKGLKKDTVFTFEYHKRVIGEETEVIEKTEESSSTIEGDPEYEYEYEYIDGGSTGTTTGGGNTTVTRQNNGGNGGTVNNRADAGDGDGAGDAGAGAAGNDGGETIEDDNTPGGILDIDDEEVAKAGGTRDTLIRNMIIGIIIAIIAVASILVTLYIANKKRKQELVKVEKHDDNE
ncbi:hypothetical protein [Pseudobutyrivibrio ruminis]|uniref:MucBP domain-containing protein n=1 Tax=Pseudobutyrivibrio ruminis DSM 9787 TaxID=1123011 RepID=A0A285RQN8_9FIRM|nr:hypothetical protein [Pseudobutyrivibrio ruminis]SOB96431.1 hypothetical protein SAMN02910411_1071 [Pseudobutyrivibrio ruminis DSM 9787]